MSYVFSRSVASTAPDYGKIAASGATIALNAEDPHLAEAVAAAKSAGAKFAIWIPAHQNQDPVAYGKKMASIAQYYKPSAILPNIEGPQGKASSGGSQWSTAMMGEYAKYMRPGDVRLDVVTEPGETDFDYHPYLQFGGGVVNEAFTGDMQQKDPDKIRQQLIDAGVPADRINILLAPGQKPGANTGGNFSAYTWDDMSPTQQTEWLSMYQQAGGPSNQSSSTATGSPTPLADPSAPSYNQVPDVSNSGFHQLDDAHNPLAQAYARKALAKNGIHVRPGQDAAAMWRDFSGKRAAQQKIAAAQPVGPDPWQLNIGTAADPRHRVAMDAVASMIRRTPAGAPTPGVGRIPMAAPATPAGAPQRVSAMASRVTAPWTQVNRLPALAANLPPADPNRLQQVAAAAQAIIAKGGGSRSLAV